MHQTLKQNSSLDPKPEACLSSRTYINSSHPDIIEFAMDATRGIEDPISKAIALNKQVRDHVKYSPYRSFSALEMYYANTCLGDGIGCCIEKAALLAAAARVVNIPARVGFANIKNHLSSPRLLDLLETDIFYWHGYTELWLNKRWVKATPTFDVDLCKKFNVPPLEFDGKNDAVFHPYDTSGQKHMEYLAHCGSYSDVPAATIMEDLQKKYPKLIEAVTDRSNSFHQEAEPLSS